MIILYGSHARGASPHNPQTGYRSDFDLLVVGDGEEVARSASVWERVRAAIEQHTTTATVDIIAHDFREEEQQIRRGQFSFVEIWQQGIDRSWCTPSDMVVRPRARGAHPCRLQGRARLTAAPTGARRTSRLRPHPGFADRSRRERFGGRPLHIDHGSGGVRSPGAT